MEAERVSYRALKDISDFNYKLDRVFKELSGMIERVASGQPAKPPDSFIQDDDNDPE